MIRYENNYRENSGMPSVDHVCACGTVTLKTTKHRKRCDACQAKRMEGYQRRYYEKRKRKATA